MTEQTRLWIQYLDAVAELRKIRGLDEHTRKHKQACQEVKVGIAEREWVEALGWGVIEADRKH